MIKLLLFCSFFFSHVFGATSYNLVPNSPLIVDEFGVCKNLTNSSGVTYIVPTGILSDWSVFLAHLPFGVTASSCTTYAWSTSDWSACSSACDGGSQTRTVNCKDNLNNIVANSFCTEPMPANSQLCNSGVVSDCSNAPNVCNGTAFNSANSCNSPQCTGIKPISGAYWGSWSNWSAWNDPGPAACTAGCTRTLTQTRTRSCMASNGCGSANCSSPAAAPGGIDTETNSSTQACSPGEGACLACNNAVPGQYCAGYNLGWCFSPAMCSGLCSNCFSKACYIGSIACGPPMTPCCPAQMTCN